MRLFSAKHPPSQLLVRGMASSGFCLKCNVTHTLPTTQDARDQALQIKQTLTSSNPPFTITRRGKMIGVLVCKDLKGNQKTLKAFAGAVNGKWELRGWSPSVGGKGTSPNDLPEYVRIQTVQNELQQVQNDLEARLVVEETNKKSNSEFGELIAKTTQFELTQLIRKRRQLALSALDEMRKHQCVSNFRGETDVLQEIFARSSSGSGSGSQSSGSPNYNNYNEIPNQQRIKMPAGVGACCATKLLADAARQDLHPMSIAEIFVGDTFAKDDGLFYDACKERCQPVLGFMLCGIHDIKT